MVRQIRRVVTGFQKDGRSTFIADSLMPSFGEDPNWPTRGVTPMWNIAKVPANHGWVNRGKEVCLVACAVIDTEHLDRSVYRDTVVLKGDEKI